MSRSLAIFFILTLITGLVMVACADETVGSEGTSPTPDVKATRGAGRSPTPTPIPPQHAVCPDGIDPEACEAASQIARQQPSEMPVRPVSATCPEAAAWLIAMEPLCTRADAGQPETGYSIGTKQMSFVDEATFRARLGKWIADDSSIGGIGCPRPSKEATLDCSNVLGLLLVSPTSGPTLLLIGREDSNAFLSGARTALLPEVTGGGWLTTTHPGLEQYVPDRLWMIPWEPDR
jgi:hypothetical protein